MEMITMTTPELTGGTMAIVAVFEFPGESVDKYEKVFEAGGPAVLDQPSRLPSHLLPDGLRIHCR
jgi:hypothetical protein